MLGDGALTFRELAMDEAVPLVTIQAAILEFLRSRDDAVLFGAQAVNAYCDEPRMTQDIDLLSPNAEALAEAISRPTCRAIPPRNPCGEPSQWS